MYALFVTRGTGTVCVRQVPTHISGCYVQREQACVDAVNLDPMVRGVRDSYPLVTSVGR